MKGVIVMWDFLDKTNHNLLYEYADVIAGTKTYLVLHSTDEEAKKEKAYYIINFVYRYVLQCTTLEEALYYIDEDTLIRYHIKPFLDNKYLYVGAGETKRTFYKSSDMSMILEILYNRYDFWEQLDCFCRGTKNPRRKRCLEAIEVYRKIYRRHKDDHNENTY